MTQNTQSPEYSNSILAKFLGHSFLYFILLIYLPVVKRSKFFRGFTPFLAHLLIGLLHEPVTELIYSTSRLPPAFYSIFIQRWILGYHTFKTTPLKEMTMMNLIIAKNEFDPYVVLWLANWQLIIFKSPNRYINSRKAVLTNIKSVSK